jgi:hypothetical protein
MKRLNKIFILVNALDKNLMRKQPLLKVKVAFGILVMLAGVGIIAYSGYNVHELLFTQGRTSLADLPVYGEKAIAPMLIGVLVLADGAIMCGFKRYMAAIPHFAANVAWIYGTAAFYDLLRKPVTEIAAYRDVFLFYMAATIAFATGAAVNSIPLKEKVKSAPEGEAS